MSEMQFPQFYRDQRDRVDDALERWLPDPLDRPEVLNRAMRYSVFNGGKRLRGVLVLEAGRLGNKTSAKVLEALAAVIEMIHAYSLVHDDLPAMDDDDMRRGKPSNHMEFGEDIAILAGDGLLTRAFEVLGHLTELGAGDQAVVEITRRVARRSGGEGLIGGQVDDLKVNDSDADEETLRNIHARKTGALITLALEIGSLASGVSEKRFTDLQTLGKQLGLSFQIKDDLLEVTGDADTLGKDPNSDDEAGKITYPSLLGADGAQESLDEMIGRARETIKELELTDGRFDQIIDLVINRDY